MIILGIDPGFGITGYGLIEVNSQDIDKTRLVEAGVLTSQKSLPFQERLEEIYMQTFEILEEFLPKAAAVEDNYSVQAFPRSAIAIGHVRGIVLLALARKKVPVYSYFPREVKKALVGSGNATKNQVQRMVESRFDLTDVTRPDDMSDALAIALCHASHMNRMDMECARS